MKIKRSQLEYLKSRKKSYNLKYGILGEFIKGIEPNSNVLELFGGVGLNTSLIYEFKKETDIKIIKWEKEDDIWRKFLTVN